MGQFSHLSDEAVEGIFDRTSDAILRVHGMSPKEQTTSRGKGLPPVASIPLLHHFFTGAARELEERGRLPKGWLDEQ